MTTTDTTAALRDKLDALGAEQSTLAMELAAREGLAARQRAEAKQAEAEREVRELLPALASHLENFTADRAALFDAIQRALGQCFADLGAFDATRQRLVHIIPTAVPATADPADRWRTLSSWDSRGADALSSSLPGLVPPAMLLRMPFAPIDLDPLPGWEMIDTWFGAMRAIPASES
jgi:hypothetical protein